MSGPASRDLDRFILEVFDENADGVKLIIRTTDPHPCSNATIASESSVSRDFIEVTINAIEDPMDCDSIPVILQSSETILPAEKDQYYLNLSLRNVIDNSGSIRIEDDHISLSIEDPRGIVIDPAVTYRLPDNIIWGYARTNEHDFGGVLVDFVTDLSLLCQATILNDGAYSGFEIDAQGVLKFDEEASIMSEETFYFQYTGDDSALESLISTYRADHGNRAEFAIFNTLGKSF